MKSAAQQALIGAVRGFARRHLPASSFEPLPRCEPTTQPLDPRREVPVCVALSGGADSLALTAAAVRAGLDVTALVVDHGLQDGSAEIAAAAAEAARELGARPRVLTVRVEGPGGPEAAARAARYAALDAARENRPVLLGHTLDDQAETVLLGLGRGSGSRSLAGMAAWNDPWGRPLLGIRRAQTRQACADWAMSAWDDPHNSDPRFTRVRLRHEVLPLLDDVLGGGVPEALGRTADQLRADTEALDSLAAELLARARSSGGIGVGALSAAPAALRTRALRAWLIECGATEPVSRLLAQVSALITDWHGQRPISVGGDAEARLVVARRASELWIGREPR